MVLTLTATLGNQYSFLQDHNRSTRASRWALFRTYIFSIFVFSIYVLLGHLITTFNTTFETTLSCTLIVAWNNVDYQTLQTRSRTTVTSKMELFVTIFDNFNSLTIVTSTIRLSLHIFSFRRIWHFNWILTNLKLIFSLYRNWSISNQV